MSYLMAKFYDRLMQPTEQACLKEWRQALLADVSGNVLEIGAGTGASLSLYPIRPDLHITLVEPDQFMRAELEEKVQAMHLHHVSVLPCPSENIACDDANFDVVFASLVCCSVNDVEQSLQEIKRVLKPGGQFIFLEHVAAKQGSGLRFWQNGLNPLWKTMAGNCHLNRETEQAITDAGFKIESIQREDMCIPMPLVRPTIRGVAVKV